MIAFVILHYNTIDSTIKTINSIMENINEDKSFIVVVDNFSTNNTGEELRKIYSDNKSVHIILNEQNLGFSKGNNIGIRYIKDNMLYSFICVMNNDIYIKENDFYAKVNSNFIENNFDVLGPNILDIHNNILQNPITVMSNYEEVSQAINISEKSRKYLYSKFPLTYYFYNKLKYRKIKRTCWGLHGSILIFSKKYIEKYNEPFPELTFMYGEEDFLFYRKQKDNLIFTYDKTIITHHDHSRSTASISKKRSDKWKFQHEKIYESLIILRNLYENDKTI